MKNEINTNQAGFTPYTIFLNAIESALALGTSGQVKDITPEERQLRLLLSCGRAHDIKIAQFASEFQVNPLHTFIHFGKRCEIASQFLNLMARISRFNTCEQMMLEVIRLRGQLTSRMISDVAEDCERAAIAEFLAA